MWKRNGLSMTLLLLVAVFVAAQIGFGHSAYNEELLQNGQRPLDLLAYLHSGHFISALFENWESEFLQMGMYVLLTVKLRQAGSAESRPLDPSQEHPRIESGPAPWPVRKGGIWRVVYGQSLAIAFATLFLASFCLHAYGSWQLELAERSQAGYGPISLWQHLLGAEFWFESFQNWQSEFLAVFALVILTIWLRQKDSPQSKAVEAPHCQTGD
ncbi:MAG TPA: hypothetical protein DDZ67_12175 [Xanthomonadaceae bacterium]|nr:hypothetical protein [Xanthomonadaceae bacterium]